MSEQDEGIERHVFLVFRLIADSYDLSYRGMALGCLEHVIRHVRARDFEPETRQVALAHAILPREGLVGKFRWAHHRPVEVACLEDSLHRRRISNRARKKQAA